MYRIFPMLMDEAGEGDGNGGRDYPKEASAMGWVEKARWTGDPNKWTDAQTFVERGEKVLPIVLKENRDLKVQVERLQQTQQQMAKDVQEFQAMVTSTAAKDKAALVARYEQALEDRASAVGDGDKDAFSAADKTAKQLEKEVEAAAAAEAARKARTSGGGEGEHPDYAEWVKTNAWYKEGTDHFDEANEIARTLTLKSQRAGKTPAVGAPLFNAVAEVMKKRHPELAKEEGDHMEGTVEGESTPSQQTQQQRGNGKAHTYDNLPPEAKKACTRFIEQGVIGERQGKTLAEKRQAYCDNYDWS